MAVINTNRSRGTFLDIQGVQIYDAATGYYVCDIEDSESITLTLDAGTTQLTGAGGKVLYTRLLARTGVLSGVSSFFSMPLLQTQLGSEFERVTNYTGVKKRELISADSNGKFFTKYVAQGDADNEIKIIFIGNIGYTQAAVASDTEFSYDSATKEITLPTGITASQIDLSYNILLSDADVLNVPTMPKNKTYDIFCSTTMSLPCGEGGKVQDRLVQLIFRANSTGTVEIAIADDMPKQNFEFTLQSGCGNDNLLTMVVYDEDSIAE